MIYGEQRGAAAADFDHDGRVDLAVSQNGTETKLYRNATAQPGVRVRLVGAQGNRDAVGASLRVEVGGVLGPAQEIQCGAGYWSSDSAVRVFGNNLQAARLHVRWPGGARTTNEIPSGTREWVVEQGGK